MVYSSRLSVKNLGALVMTAAHTMSHNALRCNGELACLSACHTCLCWTAQTGQSGRQLGESGFPPHVRSSSVHKVAFRLPPTSPKPCVSSSVSDTPYRSRRLRTGRESVFPFFRM